VSATAKTSVVVFAIALALRLITLACVLPTLRSDVDPDSYRSLAHNLAGGEGFVAEAPNGRELPNVARTPVYPLFLASLICVGRDRLGLFLVVQCVLGALTCVVSFLIAVRWMRPWLAAIAGLLVAVDPNSILRCSDLRTETLFTLLVVCAAWAMIWRCNKGWGWFASGLLWSLAALTRPIAVWIWVVALAVAFVQRVPWRNRVRYLVMFLAGFVPLLAVWATRNHAVTGRYFISSISTYNLMFRAGGIEAERQGRKAEDVEYEFCTQYGDIQFVESRERFEQSLQTYEGVAAQAFTRSPWIAFKQALLGWGKLLLGPGAHALDNTRSQIGTVTQRWTLVYVLALIAVALLSVVGMWRLGREAILPILLTLYFVALAGGPESNSRFRVPVTPMLAILAVAGVLEAERRQ
jgi:hypothetical protein